jgi:hypothetical protein
MGAFSPAVSDPYAMDNAGVAWAGGRVAAEARAVARACAVRVKPGVQGVDGHVCLGSQTAVGPRIGAATVRTPGRRVPCGGGVGSFVLASGRGLPSRSA